MPDVTAHIDAIIKAMLAAGWPSEIEALSDLSRAVEERWKKAQNDLLRTMREETRGFRILTPTE